ncbi:MAG: hypothetical protein WBG37_14395 [Desulfobacterales bacterium]|jgi:hypothetical protein
MKGAVRFDRVLPKKTPRTQTLQLIANQQLTVSTGAVESEIRILNPQGRVTLTIQVTADGPLIRMEAPECTLSLTGKLAIQGEFVSVKANKELVLGTQGDLEIHAGGNLSIDAKSIAINGREKLAHRSSGDLEIQAEGDLRSAARAQEITADLGNVDIKANDDVTLDGERIRMNC